MKGSLESSELMFNVQYNALTFLSELIKSFQSVTIQMKATVYFSTILKAVFWFKLGCLIVNVEVKHTSCI